MALKRRLQAKDEAEMVEKPQSKVNPDDDDDVFTASYFSSSYWSQQKRHIQRYFRLHLMRGDMTSDQTCWPEVDTEDNSQVLPRKSKPVAIRRRRSGVATVSLKPSLDFDIDEALEEEQQGEESSDESSGPQLRSEEQNRIRKEDYANNNSLPCNVNMANLNETNPRALKVAPTLDHVRRMSDHTLNRFLDRFRRPSAPEQMYLVSQEDQEAAIRSRAARKMSVDSSGILKRKDSLDKRCQIRKSVSFSQEDTVKFFTVSQEERDFAKEEALEKVADGGDSGWSLVPTFVVPGTKPTYSSDFENHMILFEAITISEDHVIIGTVRVNLQLAQRQRSVQHLGITIQHSSDDWATTSETAALLVKTLHNDQLSSQQVRNSRCFRFVLDCDQANVDLSIGRVVEFKILCVDKDTYDTSPEECPGKAPLFSILYMDDNRGQNYRVSCIKRLRSPWARAASQELNRYAPVFKFNKNFNCE